MLNRRKFLQLMGASTGLALADSVGLLQSAAKASAAPALRSFGSNGIEHVVILMLENRSFDHLLGWFPGADGDQNRIFPAPNGLSYPNYPLAPDYQGCGYSDPDHSWEGWLVENNNDAMNGFLMRPTTPPGTTGVPVASVNTFPIGYYTNLNPDGTHKAVPDVPVIGALAEHYTVLDRYFSSFAGETYPNRFYQHAAQTDRDHNSTTISTLPTIWDQLSAVPSTTQPTGAYFFKDIPFLALWGTKYVPFWRPWETGQTLAGFGTLPGLTFLESIEQGVLPNVSYVDPSFESEDQGTSGDYHPLCDIRVGEKFVSDVYHALADNGYLSNTVMVVTFDEWGGFFDHVEPPRVVDDTNPADVNHSGDDRPAGFPGPDYPDYTQLGFRVPTIVVSDYASPRVVNAGPYEHASSLAMIETLFDLTPLTARDANAENLLQVLTTTARADDPSASIPVSGAVPGPLTGLAAACGTASTISTPPAPVAPPADAPEFGSLTPVAPLLVAGTAGMAALALQRRRQAAATVAGADLGAATAGAPADPEAGGEAGSGPGPT